jgi:hypothetical protein
LAQNTPPQIQSALDHFRQALRATQGSGSPGAAGSADLDPLTAPWVEIEKPVIKLLGGAFTPGNQAHQNLAFMIAATLAERLRQDLGAFWFQNRSTAEGAALGFPPGIIVFSPFGAAIQALSRSQLSLLETTTAELRGAVAQAGGVGGGQQLGPEDYQRLFDPGFIQFLRFDPLALAATLATTPDVLARELSEAFTRLPKDVPAEVRDPMRKQLVGALRKLDARKPLGEQAARGPQLVELMALLKAAQDGSGFAPVELWEEVLLPLLHIGPAENFPPLDEDEKQTWQQGNEPVLLYVDALPFHVPAADEDGLLGVFPVEDVSALDPALGNVQGRIVRLATTALHGPLGRFDVAAIRTAVARFQAQGESQFGPAPAPPSQASGQPTLLDIALTLLDDLGRLAQTSDEKQGIFAVRQATEAEAGTESMLTELRKALTGPRIIMP